MKIFNFMDNQYGWIIFIVASICLSLLISINFPIQVVNAAVLTLQNDNNWTVNANGHQDTLRFSYTSQGSVSGFMYGDRIIGFWDHNSQKIIFMRLDNPSDPTSFQIYTGFLFKDTTTNSLGNPLCYQTLSGSFLTPAGAGGSATRNEYGWYAQSETL
jgi:hypothetical protein